MPDYGGVLKVAPPFLLTLPLFLGAQGRADIPFTVPTDPAVHGAVVYVQTWTNEAGEPFGGTLGNLVTLAFE